MADMEFQDYMMLLNPQLQQDVGSFYGRVGPFGGSGSVRRANAMRGGGGPGGMTQSYGGGGINPFQYSNMDPRDNPGDRLLADIIRAQTADYQTRFAPFEDFLAGSITRTGTTFLEGDLERTRGAITGASENVQGMTDRQSNRLGVRTAQLDPNATTSMLVGGLNETKLRDSDRRLQLLTGGLSGITQRARNVG